MNTENYMVVGLQSHPHLNRERNDYDEVVCHECGCSVAKDDAMHEYEKSGSIWFCSIKCWKVWAEVEE